MTNILNLPGLRVLDMKELDTEFHVKAERPGMATSELTYPHYWP